MIPFHDVDWSRVPDHALGANVRVEIQLPAGMALESVDGDRPAEDARIVFYSEATPLYASVDMIRLKGQGYLDRVPEGALYLLSFHLSSRLDDMLLFDEGEKFRAAETDAATRRRFRFYERAKSEWTSARAALDLFRQISGGRAVTSTSKTLADFTYSENGPNAKLILPLIQAFTKEAEEWLQAVRSGGAADYQSPSLAVAVKGGWNPGDTAAGIGRGWTIGGATLNHREEPVRVGNSWSRPARYGLPSSYTTLVFWR